MKPHRRSSLEDVVAVKFRTFEIESVEPLGALSDPDIMAVNVLILLTADAPDSCHRVSLRLALPKDDNATLAELSEAARALAREALRISAVQVSANNLNTLQGHSRDQATS